MMLLQIYFDVPVENTAAFEDLYDNVYVPALQKQLGYIRSTLLSVFAPNVAAEIEASTTSFNYQMELVFDTEANRRLWVDSSEHQEVWPQAASLADNIAWRGYDISNEDIFT